MLPNPQADSLGPGSHFSGSHWINILHTLLLIRHAKAAPFGNVPGDHDRPLSDRGRAQTHILANQLNRAGLVPDLALVSTARRTRQTWVGLAEQFNAAKATFIEKLYLASAEEIDKQIWLAATGVGTLAVVGHNPGMAMAAWTLLEQGTGHEPMAQEILRGQFKTAFAAQFDMSGERPKLIQLFDPRAEAIE
ncbi:MAG: phosphohistidine phosphatase [Robiginitomaculum sp.]|nr:MAG: phosphohistidine phosphatase [Robiginitomaculum sp.]